MIIRRENLKNDLKKINRISINCLLTVIVLVTFVYSQGQQNSRETASVTINFVPSNASLYIENIPKGHSPVQISGITAGREFLIQIFYPGFDTLKEYITLKPGVNPPLYYQLRRNHGVLSIEGFPEDAKITFNREDLGTSPVRGLRYPTGTYNLTIFKPEYRKLIKNVNIKTESPTDINYNLEPYSKSMAFISSAVIPGVGQLYQRRTARGLLFAASALGTGWMIYDLFNQYNNEKDVWMTNRNIYNNNLDQPELWESQKAAATDSFNLMVTTYNKMTIFIGAYGAIWSISLIDIIF